ncbi:class I SAM-dependent methyltransferase [Aliikangiella sp. IMCC44359]|uniref:class I SAM-dependent methyltransferase n=1 Tax=Aliikangiella sp. IMCC44359 TaxID=3459125 RepID=UPI00403AD131
MIVHHSLALATVINEMVSENNVILDLGSMSTGSTGAFLDLKCTCYVEDLNEYLEELELYGGDPCQRLEEHLVRKPEGLKFDFVLCWDILNYLSTDVLEYLMKLLSPHFREGTILHTMRYVGATMPKRPGNFKILSDFNFHMEHDPSVSRVPTNQLSMVKLLKHMGTFTMRKTMMNKERMQSDVTEHLLEYGFAAFAKNLKRDTQSSSRSYMSEVVAYDNISMPGISKVLQRTIKRPQNTILEAGKKNGRRMNFLSAMTDNFYVEDVFSLMTWHKKIAINSTTSFSENTLLFARDVSFDLVLLWDLFNFLQIEQIEKLLQLLERHLAPGSYVHCILFKNDGAPDSPAVFEINDDLSVSVKGDVCGKQVRSISNTAQLMMLMSRFKMESTHFGCIGKKENYLEFIFEFKGSW